MKKLIVGIGEILWDVFPEGKVLGGAPANFAYHIAQFGYEGFVVSAIGKDIAGEEILQSLANRKLNHLIETVAKPTGSVLITLDQAGVPQYKICEQVAWDFIPFTPQLEDMAKNTMAVCFGSLAQRSHLSRDTINRFLDQVPEEAYKIFDINLRQHFYSRELIHKSLLKCNVLKINDEEAAVVSTLFDWKNLSETSVCRKLLSEFNLRMVILTKGSLGSCVFTPTETSFCETPKVTVADTVGAGDSFTAAFIAALLHGQSIQKAHQFAVDVSAYVCTQNGAMPKLPDCFLETVEK
ncbi:MAG: carbohydrate kinase [Bacteroidota bacterium]|nr:carbohydrate kinase [Bacteroidota bacterium]